MKPILIVSGCSVFFFALVVAMAVLFVVRRHRPKKIAARRTPAAPVYVPPVATDTTPDVQANEAGALEERPFPQAAENPSSRPDVGSQTVAAAEFDPNATIVVKATASVTLVCLSGTLEGSRFHVTEAGLYIGREWSQAQIVIDDTRISKRHAWVGIRNGKCVVIDHDSLNGTFVNTLDNRVTEAQLTSTDTLILPEDVARFVVR